VNLNGAHLHLAINHSPLFAVLFGALALASNLHRGSIDLRRFSSALFILAAMLCWITGETGEQAEHLLKPLDPTTRPWIHEHEEAAEWAQALCIGLALGAAILEWACWKKKAFAQTLSWILLLGALLSGAALGRTSYLGGLIRHTEIRTPLSENGT
jgi:hypothetical protein